MEDGGDEHIAHFMIFNYLVFSPLLPKTVQSTNIGTSKPSLELDNQMCDHFRLWHSCSTYMATIVISDLNIMATVYYYYIV